MPVKQLLHEEPLISSDHKKSSKTIATRKSITSKGLLHPLSKVNKIGRKVVTRSKDVTISNKTRQQKIEAVVRSVEVLTKDNNRLRLVCRYDYLTTILLACIYDVVIVMHHWVNIVIHSG